MSKHPIVAGLLFGCLAIPALSQAENPFTTRAFTWTDGCGESMSVTLRVYRELDAAGFPSLYKWDYEVHNVTVGQTLSGAGVSDIRIYFKIPLLDLAGIYPPQNWITTTDGSTFLEVAAPFNSTLGLTTNKILPGGTVDFGFTTFARRVEDAPACALDANGNLIANACGYATWTSNFIPLKAPLRELSVPLSHSDAPRPEAACVPGTSFSGEIAMPGAPVLVVTQTTSMTGGHKHLPAGAMIQILDTPEMPLIIAGLPAAPASDTVAFQLDATDAYGDHYTYPPPNPGPLAQPEPVVHSAGQSLLRRRHRPHLDLQWGGQRGRSNSRSTGIMLILGVWYSPTSKA